MIYAETLDALCNLPNEDIGQIVKHIKTWNDGLEPVVENPYHKMIWAMILPDLERNRETYVNIVERNRENGKKGGRPKKDTETQSVYLGNPEEPQKTNYNYNYNNSSKEELYYTKEPPSPKGDEVVSKGLESLEKLFPQGRNYIGIDELNLWDKLSQQEKQVMIKRGAMYIRNEKKKDDGKYIKGIGKWMREQKEQGLEEKQPSIKNSTKIDDPRLLKMVDGNIYSQLLGKVSNSTKTADKLYYLLNKKEMFSSKDELSTFVRNLNQQEINDLIN